jgi:hypothetical protein
MAHPTKQRGRSISKEASRSALGISKHTELAAFFYFGKSDAEEGGFQTAPSH